MNIELTKEEAETLVQLLDVAVKTIGLQAAEPALNIVKKVYEGLELEITNSEEVE